MNNKPLVLILCTGNSCRSQIAEAFLRQFHGDTYQVASAGTAPKDAVHPLAIQVMAEIGIDIGEQKPKALDIFLGHQPVRHLLIVCENANGTCPRIWPGAFTRDYVPFDDPADAHGTPDAVLSTFRRVRDEIKDYLKRWKPTIQKVAQTQ